MRDLRERIHLRLGAGGGGNAHAAPHDLLQLHERAGEDEEHARGVDLIDLVLHAHRHHPSIEDGEERVLHPFARDVAHTAQPLPRLVELIEEDDAALRHRHVHLALHEEASDEAVDLVLADVTRFDQTGRAAEVNRRA